MDTDALPLSRTAIDPDARARTEPDLIERLLADPHTRVLPVAEARVPVAAGALALEPPAPRMRGVRYAYLGRDAGGPVLAQMHRTGEGARAADDPQGMERRWQGLREVGATLSARDAGLAVTAVGLAAWHSTHTHCPRCGTPTEVIEAGWVRHCPADDSQHFPRTDPAVIMAIVDAADRLLLGNNIGWPRGRYSVPAGFVEPGESLEAAVRREVQEEMGVRVGAVAYQGSQPWPFPASLMLGFRGEALDCEAVPDGVEIAEAHFLTRAQVDEQVAAGRLRLPQETSIAHHLIRDWYGGPLPRSPQAW